MFYYFGYGSNMDATSIRAKDVHPMSSVSGYIPGWALSFDVRHFFDHEGGVANIRYTGRLEDRVFGVVHLCQDEELALLDAVEAYGVGYDHVEVEVQTLQGSIKALCYIGMDSFIDEGCRPTRRYLNILVKGADKAGIDPEYVNRLREHPIHIKKQVPDFVPPLANQPIFTSASLQKNLTYTALAGSVFDMSQARWQHQHLVGLFGGKDMTLWHLKRLDTSDGKESLDDIKHNRLSSYQLGYLNEYLHEYNTEYNFIGRFIYDNVQEEQE